jgi:hypothetical protein
MARTRSPAHAGASIITGIDTNPMTMLAKQARPYLKARLPYGFPLAAQRVAVGPVRTPSRLPLSCAARPPRKRTTAVSAPKANGGEGEGDRVQRRVGGRACVRVSSTEGCCFAVVLLRVRAGGRAALSDQASLPDVR